MKMECVGIDFAGVIADIPTRLTVEEFEKVKSNIHAVLPMTPGFALLRTVSEMFRTTYIISAASNDEIIAVTRKWLQLKDFWTLTGISEENLIFTVVEPEAKSNACKDRGICLDLFIDDNPDFLEGFGESVTTRIFFDRGEGEKAPPQTTRVSSWEEVVDFLNGDGI